MVPLSGRSHLAGRTVDEEKHVFHGRRQYYNKERERGRHKCGPAYSAAAHLPALPHPLGYFWPGKLAPTRFSALLNALQQKTNYQPSTILQCWGSRIRCLFAPWIRDTGWVKNRSGSGKNILDHISESLETIFLGKKYLNSLMRMRDPEFFDPGSGMEKFGSGINIPVPQNCYFGSQSLLVCVGYQQCFGSVSGIRDWVSFWPLDPGWTTRIIFFRA